jgi:ribose transport system ATP-binding protein
MHPHQQAASTVESRLTAGPPRLDMSGISKTFGRARVLIDVDGAAGSIRVQAGATQGGDIVRELDLDIAAGEIVGITGPTEAGHEELPYLVAGAHAEGASGTIAVDGVETALGSRTVEPSIRSGVVLVPADRSRDGVAVTLTAQHYLTVPRVRSSSRAGWLRQGWQRREFVDACEQLSIVPADPDLRVEFFSGGNQPKILLAKWLLHRPKVLVLHEPTQAVDVGARADILSAIGRAADDGATVLISCIEAQDLALVCDRVLVLREGRVVRELRAPMTADDILHAT